MFRYRFWSILAVAALIFAARPAIAEDAVSSWATIRLPPPPALKPVKIDPGQTALLVLDFSSQSCTQQQRPRCLASLPAVAKMLAEARAHQVSVVYSTVPNGSVSDTPPVVAPRPGEPSVTSGPDKFLNTDLEKILQAKHIHTVIVVGTIAQGAVLYTASEAALRGFEVIVPVDGMSASDAFGEAATAWILANGPASVLKHMTVSRSNLITY